MTKTTYSLSTGMPPDRRVGRPPVGLLLLPLQALHLLGELLLRGEQPPGDDVLHLGELLARRELALDVREVALQAGHLQPLLRDLLLAAAQVAVEDGRLPADRRELLLEPGEKPREVLLRALERRRLPHLVEDEEQDDRPEAAAHHVEEREAEHLERSPLPPSHGQALDGVMNDPRVAMASFQKAGVAMGSPSMGKRMTLTGTPRGSSSSARSKWRRRSLPETVRRPGGAAPWVGSPSVSRMMLSGGGLMRLRRGEGVEEAGAPVRRRLAERRRPPCPASCGRFASSHTPSVPAQDRPRPRC